MYRSPVSLDTALAKVGITPDAVLAEGGSILAAGLPYLVGSLAQGFGNRGSDVDIQLFVADLDRPSPAFLFFVDGVPVDIEHIPVAMPADLLENLSEKTVETGLGPIAIAPSLDEWQRWALTRWCTALPLRDDAPPLVPDAALQVLYPHLLRGAVDRLALTWAQAELVSRTDRDPAYLWGVCRSAVLDVACTAAGSPPIGEKWLPRRVECARLSTDLLTRVEAIKDGGGMVHLLHSLGLRLTDPLTMTMLTPDPELREVVVGKNRFLLTRQGTLVPATELPKGGCADVLASDSAERTVDHLRFGLLGLELDSAALSGALVA